MSFDDIIDHVKRWPELWQSSHKFYKWKIKQNEAWQQIASEISVDEKVLRTRWKYLKDHYRKELKRLMTNEITTSRWQYFDSLEFLSEELLKEGKKRVRWDEEDEDDEEPLQKVSVCLEPSSSTSQDSLQEFGDKLNKTSVKNDPDYMFLMSILPTLQNLTDVQKFVFRGKVNEWLLEALTQNEFNNDCKPVFTLHRIPEEIQTVKYLPQ